MCTVNKQPSNRKGEKSISGCAEAILGKTKDILVLGCWVESLVTFGLAAGDTYRRNSDEKGLEEAASWVPGRQDDRRQHGG